MIIRLRNVFVRNVCMCMSVYVYTWLDVEEGRVEELLFVLGAEEAHV